MFPGSNMVEIIDEVKSETKKKEKGHQVDKGKTEHVVHGEASSKIRTLSFLFTV